MATQTQTSVITRRPRWKSILKWFGLYLLVQVVGEFAARPTGIPAPFIAATLLGGLVIHYLVTRKRT